MYELRELQEQFLHFLLAHNKGIFNRVLHAPHLSTETRLNIYRDGYYLRLLDVLNTDYPVLKTLIGKDAFVALGESYIKSNPSHHFSLRWFSQNFSQFLVSQSQCLWIIEMAQFEWALTVAFDGLNHFPIGLEDVAVISPDQWPDMYFDLHPCLQQLSFYSNIMPLWLSVKDDRLIDVVVSSVARPCLIWRDGLDVQFHSISDDESYVLQMIKNKRNFGDICGGLGDFIEVDIDMHAAMLLKKYILNGFLIKVNLV